MSRRASSGISPGLLTGVAVALVAAFFGGKMLLTKKETVPNDAPPLAVWDFVERGNGMRGSVYRLEGVIDEQIVSDTEDRLVFLKVNEGGQEALIGVKIPAGLSAGNIEREQRYSFRVRIEKEGIPVATAMNRL